ncbi:UvrD-helicase domain-containing protein [Terasakiella sp.]|uniref:UvrD-helicase domain-containing protein n=1 Tax=Terasakiella sp. TaxID=2034861 RepID=UPI003AA9D58A
MKIPFPKVMLYSPERMHSTFEKMEPGNLVWVLSDPAAAAAYSLTIAGLDILEEPKFEIKRSDLDRALREDYLLILSKPFEVRSYVASKRYLQKYLDLGIQRAEELGFSFISLEEYWRNPNGVIDLKVEQNEQSKSYLNTSLHYRGGENVKAPNQKVAPTDEQEKILEAAHHLTGSDILKTQAFAGTGKTTLCSFIADTVECGSAIYLAFNKVMQQEGKQKLGSRMDCRTTDSLAYAITKPWEEWGDHRVKTGMKFPYAEVADRIGLPAHFDGFKKGALIRQLYLGVQKFCYSADEWFSEKHLTDCGWDPNNTEQLLEWMTDIWSMLMLPNSDLPISPEQVMKLWDLREGTIPYDAILFDEAQDANPAFMSILKRSESKRFLIGDNHQQLYDWRGAVNSMSELSGSTYPLTKSWRFGEKVADYVNAVLQNKSKSPEDAVKGNTGLTTKIKFYDPEYGVPKWPITVLARTNMSVFNQAVTVSEQGHTIHIVGGVNDLNWIISDALKLYRGTPANNVHHLISRFPNWDALVDEQEFSGDAELYRIRTIVETHHKTLEQQLALINRQFTPNEKKAAAVLSTTHKVKGREWANVVLTDDFISKDELAGLTPWKRDAELNILYVAATRAVDELYIPNNLRY